MNIKNINKGNQVEPVFNLIYVNIILLIIISITLNFIGLLDNDDWRMSKVIRHIKILIIFLSLILKFQFWILRIQKKLPFSIFLIFSPLFLFIFSFYKKLICLLSLELIILIFIFNFLILGGGKLGDQSSFISFVLLCFIVLDRALGISLLLCSSRDSVFLLRGVLF